MKRMQSSYVLSQPARRPLKVFASDPMASQSLERRITIDIPNESPLLHGPRGARLEVVDYDGGHDRFYPPVNLNDRAILMQGGLDPTESDPRFHQQMVYAVASKTLENFDRALGRRLELRRKGFERLRLFPHAFHGANAFYSSDLNAILFGYFLANPRDPGANIPGQNVFTCLSHDVITHEMTHALVHRLRRYFLEPSNEDVLGFHEGFADLVALFQHFSFQEILQDQIQRSRADLRQPGMLVDLAQQFGHATGMNRALRSALGKRDAKLYQTTTEAHARGSILVAAVFDAFFEVYQRRIKDLLRIATGGTGTLPAGDMHPDLGNRIAAEAAQTAQSILTMCIRAFDYLPPVDIRFGDFLRALVTADYELVPTDPCGQRQAMIEAFRVRGIYADDVVSLAEESLLWEAPDPPLAPLPSQTQEMLRELAFSASTFGRITAEEEAVEEAARERYGQSSSVSPEGTERSVSEDMAAHLHKYAEINAKKGLLLDPAVPIEVAGFHPVFRVGPDGQLLIELVAQFAQKQEHPELGGIPFRGGTTVVAAADGRVRYLIAKPLASEAVDPQTKAEAEARLETQRRHLALWDMADPTIAFTDDRDMANRMIRRMSLAALHQGAG
jgi:hypothetical protein